MIEFRATHIITHRSAQVSVMLVPNGGGWPLSQPDHRNAGPAYTREEWDSETSADFEFNGSRWSFQGRRIAATDVVCVNEFFRASGGGIDTTARAAFWERASQLDMSPPAPTRAELLAMVVPPPVRPAVKYEVAPESPTPVSEIEWWLPADDPRSGR